MKKIAIILGVLAVLAGIITFIVPILVDPNKYKTEIEAKFEEQTGYDLDIGGEIKLSVFPQIEIIASNISVSSGSKTFADVENISAFMELFPLFSGQYKVKAIEITNPQINLEKYENSNNWTSKKSKSTEASDGAAGSSTKSAMPDLAIDDIRVIGGFVSFTDAANKQSVEIKDITLVSKLQSANGPFSFNGLFSYEDERIDIGGHVDNFADPKIILGLGAYDSALGYEGGLEEGKITFQTPDINKILAKLPGKKLSFPNPKGDFDGKISFKDSQLEVSELKFKFGSSGGKGFVTADLNGLLTILSADFKFDKLIAEELVPKVFDAAAEEEESSGRKKKKTGPEATNNLYAVINLDAAEVLYKKATFTNFMMRTEIDGKEITIQPISVEFPGGGKAELLGVISENSKKEKYFEGKMELNAKDLSKILEGLEVDVSAVQPNKLKNLNIDTQIFANFGEKPNIEFANTNAKFNDSKFKGRFEVALQSPLKISARGGIDKVDADNILVPEKEKERSFKQKKVDNLERKLDFSWLKQFPVDLNIALALGRLTYKDERYSDVQLSAFMKKGIFDIEKFYFNSKKMEASGKIKLNVQQARPKFDTDLTISTLHTGYFIQDDSASSPSKVAKKGEARWSEEPFDLWPLDQFDAEFKARIENFSHDRLSFKATRVNGYLKDSKLGIEDLTTYGLGGKLNMNGNLIIGNIPAFNVNYSGTDLDLYRVAKGFANIDTVNGLATITGNMSSSGPNQKNMVKNLKGATAIAGINIYVKGFDLESFASQITNINNANSIVSLLRTVSSGQGVTLIKSVKGNIGVENGIAQTSGINLDAGSGQGIYKGYADLNKWYMDTTAEFKLVMADSKERPPLGIRISGPIDDPAKDVDTSAVRKYVTNRAARNLLKNDKIPEKYQGIVEGLTGGGINDESGAARKKTPEENLLDLLKGL